jgi:YaiO family outer membrane protein
MRILRTLACASVLACASAVSGQEPDHEWLAARYEASLFDDDSEAWHYASLEAGMRRSRLTPIVRVNGASRFGETGFQLETDLYPVWPGVGYAYLSGAYSPDAPFPEKRLAAELFVTLPAALEASAGVVYLDFPDDALLVVGSLSKYAGDYWLSARPSFTTGDADLGITLIARRYLRSSGEFVTLRLLGGRTAEEIANRGITRLETIGAQADAQLEIAPRLLLLPLAGVAREELPNGPQRMRYSLGLGAMVRF